MPTVISTDKFLNYIVHTNQIFVGPRP